MKLEQSDSLNTLSSVCWEQGTRRSETCQQTRKIQYNNISSMRYAFPYSEYK
jgi:hypothetical protein